MEINRAVYFEKYKEMFYQFKTKIYMTEPQKTWNQKLQHEYPKFSSKIFLRRPLL